MERKTRSALDRASVPPVFEATQSQPREVQQKSAGFGSFWKLPFYKCDSPMKMVRAEGAIGWINSGDLLSKWFGGKKGTDIFIWRKSGQGGKSTLNGPYHQQRVVSPPEIEALLRINYDVFACPLRAGHTFGHSWPITTSFSRF